MTELNFRSFTLDMLLITCILSGCDYLESIKGVGFKTAHRFVWERIQQRVILLSMGNSVLSKWLFRCRASALPVIARARTHARNAESVRPIE